MDRPHVQTGYRPELQHDPLLGRLTFLEDTRFYELCDENGVMVWQDFGMGCTFYSQRYEFARAIEREVTSVVMKLRSHPSIALWSGNNENDQTLTIGTLAPFRIDPNRDVVSRQVIRWCFLRTRPLAQLPPSSPYWSEEVCQQGLQHRPAARRPPVGPRGYYKDPFYTNANCLFVSEIGYHGMPNLPSLEKMFPAETVYPWTDRKEFRWNEDWLTKAVRIFKEWGYTPERNNLMINQVRLLFGEVPTELDDFIFASQSVQAEAMKFFVEIYRGNKFAPKNRHPVVEHPRRMACDFRCRGRLLLLAQNGLPFPAQRPAQRLRADQRRHGRQPPARRHQRHAQHRRRHGPRQRRGYGTRNLPQQLHRSGKRPCGDRPPARNEGARASC